MRNGDLQSATNASAKRRDFGRARSAIDAAPFSHTAPEGTKAKNERSGAMRYWMSGAVAATTLLATVSASADEPKLQPAAETNATSTTAVTSAETASVTPSGTLSAPPTRETTTLYQSVRPNKAYLYTGGVLFLGSYAATATLTGIAANEDRPTVDRNLYIPVIGPWLHLADDAKTASNSTGDSLLVAGSGIIQGAGVAMIIASFFVPERVPAATIQAGVVKMHVTPMSMGRAGSGLGAVGTF
jgi:hypothetical protein